MPDTCSTAQRCIRVGFRAKMNYRKIRSFFREKFYSVFCCFWGVLASLFISSLSSLSLKVLFKGSVAGNLSKNHQKRILIITLSYTAFSFTLFLVCFGILRRFFLTRIHVSPSIIEKINSSIIHSSANKCVEKIGLATGLYIEMSIFYLSGEVVWLGSDVFGSALPVPTFSLILLVEICTFLFTGLVFIGDFCRLKIPPSPSSSCSDFGRSLKTGSSFISSSVMFSSKKWL